MSRLPPRIVLATLPTPLAAMLAAATGFNSCWASELPFCIYFWYPPYTDVLFALLVLAPFITSWRFWPFRLIALIAVSVLTHSWSVGLLVNTRGSLMIPGVDSIFLNVLPIAMAASLIMAGMSALIAGMPLTRRFLVFSTAAGLPAAAVFLLLDFRDLMIDPSVLVFLVWHVSICAAMFLGSSRSNNSLPLSRLRACPDE